MAGSKAGPWSARRWWSLINDTDWEPDSNPRVLKASHNCRDGCSLGVEQPFAIEVSVVPDSGSRQACALKLNVSRNTTMVPASNDPVRENRIRMASVYPSSIPTVNGIPHTESFGLMQLLISLTLHRSLTASRHIFRDPAPKTILVCRIGF